MNVVLIVLKLEWPRYRLSNVSLNRSDLERELDDEMVEKFADALLGQTENISEEERKKRWDALGECLELINLLRAPELPAKNSE